jgi:hypothetical protein
MSKGSIEWEYDPENGLVLRIRPMFRKMMSGESRARAREFRKDVLTALRSLIDAAVKKMEEGEKTPAKSRNRTARTKIKVE